MKPPCSCCRYYRGHEFEKDVDQLWQMLLDINFDGVYGPPRGGLTLATALSHRLDIPQFLDGPKSRQTLVVDDIADKGTTLRPFADKGNLIITLFYHKQSITIPNIWLHEKKNKFIIYFWEKQECVNKNKSRS